MFCVPPPEWKGCRENPDQTLWCRGVWEEDQAFGEAEKGCESYTLAFLLYCSSSFAIGESLCAFCFLYVQRCLFHFLAPAYRYWRWTSSGTFSGTPWSHSLSKRYSNDFTAVVKGVGRHSCVLDSWILLIPLKNIFSYAFALLSLFLFIIIIHVFFYFLKTLAMLI